MYKNNKVKLLILKCLKTHTYHGEKKQKYLILPWDSTGVLLVHLNACMMYLVPWKPVFCLYLASNKGTNFVGIQETPVQQTLQAN